MLSDLLTMLQQSVSLLSDRLTLLYQTLSVLCDRLKLPYYVRTVQHVLYESVEVQLVTLSGLVMELKRYLW
jgi:hypothetical protein